MRVCLEAFALDAQDALDHSLQTDLTTLQEQLEVQQIQLGYLLNEIRWLQWVKNAPSPKEKPYWSAS